MISRLWSKSHTQSAIKALRVEGFVVTKIDEGYECFIDGNLIFRAMLSNTSYLVRYNENLYL